MQGKYFTQFTALPSAKRIDMEEHTDRSSKVEYPLKLWYEAKYDSWKILESYGLKQNYNDE